MTLLRKLLEFRTISLTNEIMQALCFISVDNNYLKKILKTCDLTFNKQPINISAIYKKTERNEKKTKEIVVFLQNQGAIVDSSSVVDLFVKDNQILPLFEYYLTKMDNKAEPKDIDRIYRRATSRCQLNYITMLRDQGYKPPDNLLDSVFLLDKSKEEVEEVLNFLLSSEMQQTITDESISKCTTIKDGDAALWVANKLLGHRVFPDDKLIEAISFAVIHQNHSIIGLLLDKLKQPELCNIRLELLMRNERSCSKEMWQAIAAIINRCKVSMSFKLYCILKTADFNMQEFIESSLIASYGSSFVNQNKDNIKTILTMLSKVSEKESVIDDIVKIVVKVLIDYKYASEEESLDSYLYYNLPGSIHTWTQLYPDFNLPTALVTLSPYGFTPEVYKEILPITQQACKDEENTGAKINAYKLAVLFDTNEEAKQYLQTYKDKHPTRKQPVHDACLFELPKYGIWHIPFWRKKVVSELNKTPNKLKFRQLLPLTADIEHAINGINTPVHRLQEGITQEESLGQQQLINIYKSEITEQLEDYCCHSIRLPSGNKAPTITQWKNFIVFFKEHYPLDYAYYLHTQASKGKTQKPYRAQLQKIIEEQPDKSEYEITDAKDETKKYTILLTQREQNESPAKRANILAYKAAYTVLQSHMEEPENKDDCDFFTLMKTFIKRRDLSELSYGGFIAIVVNNLYGDIGTKYHDFATACARFGIPVDALKKTIKTLEEHPRVNVFIPKVEINGDENNFWSGYRLEKMESNDLMIGLAGKFTSCCQSIGGAGGEPADHALHNPFGSIYRIMKGNKWIAQAWVGLTKDNTLVLDSIEYNQGYNQQKIMSMYEAAAKQIIASNPEIKRVVFGGGGNTPKQHGFPLQTKPGDDYPGIIGYENGSYDSKQQRYVLAENEQFTCDERNFINKVTPTVGTDTIVKVGKRTPHYLSAHPYTRNEFLTSHPKILAALRQHKDNPLLEEGFYENGDKREHYGEHFIPFAMMKPLVKRKVEGKVDHLIMVENNPSELQTQLQDIRLQEGQTALILYVDDVHAQAGCLAMIGGQLRCLLVDSENDDFGSSILLKTVQATKPTAAICYTTARLQRDYFSCSTFAMKALGYFAKYGKDVWKKDSINKVSAGEVKALTLAETPAQLLKMSQTPVYEKGAVPDEMKNKTTIEVDKEVLETTVSHKHKLSLAQYLQFYTTPLSNEKTRNSAALEKKYHYLEQWEKNRQPQFKK